MPLVISKKNTSLEHGIAKQDARLVVELQSFNAADDAARTLVTCTEQEARQSAAVNREEIQVVEQRREAQQEVQALEIDQISNKLNAALI